MPVWKLIPCWCGPHWDPLGREVYCENHEVRYRNDPAYRREQDRAARKRKKQVQARKRAQREAEARFNLSFSRTGQADPSYRAKGRPAARFAPWQMRDLKRDAAQGNVIAIRLLAGLPMPPPHVPAQEQPHERSRQVTAFVSASTEDIGRHFSSDQQEHLPVRSPGQLRRKLEAEHDDHALSRDWDSSTPGALVLYTALAEKAIKAQAVTATVTRQFRRSHAKELDWLLHGNGFPLISIDGNVIVFLQDPRGRPGSKYPGAPEGTSRSTPGRNLGKRAQELVMLIRACRDGASMTNRQVCQVMNSEPFRRDFDLQGCKYLSVSACSNIHVKMRKAGTLRITRPAEHYRDGHRWRLHRAAVQKCVLQLGDSDLAAMIGGHITSVLDRELDDQELRDLVRDRAQAF